MIVPTRSARSGYDAMSAGGLTVGVEEEFLLVEVDGGMLAPIGPELVSALAAEDERFTYELRAAQVETVTRVCLTVAEIERELQTARSELARAAAGRGRLLAVPVNPASQDKGPATDKERYRQILDDAPWARQGFLTCGMHIHLGVGNAERAIAVHDALRSYLPLLGALAANSPIYAGADIGVASARAQLKQLKPRFGVPPSFGSFERYDKFLRWGATDGVIPDPSYHWYDLRLNPLHGTIEVRVFDVQTDVAYAAALVALTQALASWLLARHKDGEQLPVHDHHRIQEALWLAARDGAQGALPDLETGILIPVAEQLAQLLPKLDPHANDLGCSAQLDHIWKLTQQPGHAQQRRIHTLNGVLGLLDWLAVETVPSDSLKVADIGDRLAAFAHPLDETARRWLEPAPIF